MKLLVCLLSAQTGCHLFGWIYRDGELQSCQCVLVLQSSLCVEVPQSHFFLWSSRRERDGDPTFKWSSVVNEMFIVLRLVLPALLYLHQLPPALWVHLRSVTQTERAMQSLDSLESQNLFHLNLIQENTNRVVTSNLFTCAWPYQGCSENHISAQIIPWNVCQVSFAICYPLCTSEKFLITFIYILCEFLSRTDPKVDADEYPHQSVQAFLQLFLFFCLPLMWVANC